MTVWSAGVNWHEPAAHATRYDRALGAANSAVLVRPDEEPVLVVGHANGFLSLWSARALPALSMLETVDVRSEQPTNPWGLHNVRSLAALDDRRIICGSEDGLLSVVIVPSGEVLTQTVSNPRAHRGINAIALSKAGDLLVANCSVGRDDSNLWYFTLDASDPRPKPELRDHANLRVNPEAPQVFNFSTVWAIGDAESRFFCSTEEGALWMGGVAERELGLLGYQQVTSPLGSALSFAPDGRLVLVSHDLYEFRVPWPSG